MCVISNKIKFCTCVDAAIDIEELNHYWVLNRYNEHKKLYSIGTVVPSIDEFNTNYMENQFNISNALSKEATCDKQISFKAKDRLEVVLNNNSENSDEVMTFEFEYKSGAWQSIDDDDPFYLLNHFDEINSGEIKEIE
jgi:hypothetical protein